MTMDRRAALSRIISCVACTSGNAAFAQRAAQSSPHEPSLREQRRQFIIEANKQQDAEWRRAFDELTNRGIRPYFPPPPRIVAFADWDYYYTVGDRQLIWQPNQGQKFRAVGVPVGFVSDLASVPRIFWSVLPRQGRYGHAAIVHDYLYWAQERSREESDDIFKTAMEDSKVDSITIATMYQAVRYGGESAWKANALSKAAGEKRIMKRYPDSGDITWEQWKRTPGILAD
jgi:Protein of unknown function (DUF1353)